MSTPLDRRISQCLSAGFRHESRRSLLSKITRGLFVLAGVQLPAALAPEAFAQQPAPGGRRPSRPVGSWEWCGLHGYVCQGNCHPNAPGNSGTAGDRAHPLAMWVACCQHPDSGRWRLVQYVDYCGTRGRYWGRQCQGTDPAGPTWCGGRDGAYVCTEVRVIATDYATAADCRRANPARPRDGVWDCSEGVERR